MLKLRIIKGLFEKGRLVTAVLALLMASGHSLAQSRECPDKSGLPPGLYAYQMQGGVEFDDIEPEINYQEAQDLLEVQADINGERLNKKIYVKRACDWVKSGYELLMSSKAWKVQAATLAKTYRFDKVVAIPHPAKGDIEFKGIPLFDNDSWQIAIPKGEEWLKPILAGNTAGCVSYTYNKDEDLLVALCSWQDEQVSPFGGMETAIMHNFTIVPRISLYRGKRGKSVVLYHARGMLTASSGARRHIAAEVKENICRSSDTAVEFPGFTLCSGKGDKHLKIENCTVTRKAHDRKLDLLAVSCREHRMPFFMRSASHCRSQSGRFMVTNPYWIRDSGELLDRRFEHTQRLVCVVSSENNPSARAIDEL